MPLGPSRFPPQRYRTWTPRHLQSCSTTFAISSRAASSPCLPNTGRWLPWSSGWPLVCHASPAPGSNSTASKGTWQSGQESASPPSKPRFTDMFRNTRKGTGPRLVLPIHQHRFGGPPPFIEGLLLLIDPFSRWPEAILIPDINSTMVARAFLCQWVSRFGDPAEIKSDRWTQFISQSHGSYGPLYTKQLLITRRCGGLVEQFHQQLKASLSTCLNGPN